MDNYGDDDDEEVSSSDNHGDAFVDSFNDANAVAKAAAKDNKAVCADIY